MCPRKCEVAGMNYLKNTSRSTRVVDLTYAGVIIAFLVVTLCQNMGLLSRQTTGMLVPICC